MRRWLHLASRLRRETPGSALIETALALTIAIPLVLVAFEICMFTYTQAVIGDAARMGIRYAIVHGSDSASCSGPSEGCSDPSGANVVSTVQSYVAQSVKTSAGISITVSYPDASSAPPNRVNVTVEYNYSPFFKESGASTAIPMYATAEGRIVY